MKSFSIVVIVGLHLAFCSAQAEFVPEIDIPEFRYDPFEMGREPENELDTEMAAKHEPEVNVPGDIGKDSSDSPGLSNSQFCYGDRCSDYGHVSGDTLKTAMLAELYDNSNLGDSPENAASSCKDIRAKRFCGQRSGYYWVQSLAPENGKPVKVFCDMHGECCDGKGVYTEVANFDKNDPWKMCPTSLRQVDTPRKCCAKKRSDSCDSVTFPTYGFPYSRVCGEVSAYLFGSPDGLRNKDSSNIDGIYLDGISITHGQNPRQHIWSFVVTFRNCSCAEDTIATLGEDYYCDNGGYHGRWKSVWHPTRLFQGRCQDGNQCCSSRIFCKELPKPTSDDIEVRLCTDQSLFDENIGLELIKLYIQ